MLTKCLIPRTLQVNAAAKYRMEKNMHPVQTKKLPVCEIFVTHPVILRPIIIFLRPRDN